MCFRIKNGQNTPSEVQIKKWGPLSSWSSGRLQWALCWSALLSLLLSCLVNSKLYQIVGSINMTPTHQLNGMQDQHSRTLAFGLLWLLSLHHRSGGSSTFGVFPAPHETYDLISQTGTNCGAWLSSAYRRRTGNTTARYLPKLTATSSCCDLGQSQEQTIDTLGFINAAHKRKKKSPAQVWPLYLALSQSQIIGLIRWSALRLPSPWRSASFAETCWNN